MDRMPEVSERYDAPSARAWEVRLREPVEADVETLMALADSPEIRGMYGGDPALVRPWTRERAEAWRDRLAARPCAWVIEAGGVAVGEARLDGIDASDGRARLAIGLLADEHLGRGIGRIAVGLVLDHAFGPLDLHRVDLRVLAFNRRAIRCYLACGFVHEGTEREAARVAGGWHDDWIMAILRHEHAAGTVRHGG